MQRRCAARIAEALQNCEIAHEIREDLRLAAFAAPDGERGGDDGRRSTNRDGTP